MKPLRTSHLTVACLTLMLLSLPVLGISESQLRRQFDTDIEKRTIDLTELRSGGPGKDGIPSIDKPRFTTFEKADKWLDPLEPVIALQHKNTAKAYPLQILIWHEIVNDTIAQTPVAVTFCPLCYSAIVFNRQVDSRTLEFGVSGLLRNSDLVMYDRRTETLWQQLTGNAIVGDLVPATLCRLPAQIISYREFKKAFPRARVLSRETGHNRRYGHNPYAGYDNVNKKPFLYDGESDPRVKPMQKLITAQIKDTYQAYPYSVTRKARVINHSVKDTPVAVFHAKGAVSALDASRIAESGQSGSTGLFNRRLDDKTLTFEYKDGQFIDTQTRSRWNITGRATAGELKGSQLKPITHGDYFAFAWLAFRPETRIYTPEKSD